jgi:hypothetical protein
VEGEVYRGEVVRVRVVDWDWSGLAVRFRWHEMEEGRGMAEGGKNVTSPSAQSTTTVAAFVLGIMFVLLMLPCLLACVTRRQQSEALWSLSRFARAGRQSGHTGSGRLLAIEMAMSN